MSSFNGRGYYEGHSRGVVHDHSVSPGQSVSGHWREQQASQKQVIRIVRCRTCQEDRIVDHYCADEVPVDKLICDVCKNPVMERA